MPHELLANLHEDLWQLERGVEYSGVVGTKVVQYYSADWDVDLDAAGLSGGSPMPTTVGSLAEGAGATIVEVLQAIPGHIRDMTDTNKRCLTVVGFQELGWVEDI
jgi:hypothetical protein